jgi:hypothetical protein
MMRPSGNELGHDGAGVERGEHLSQILVDVAGEGSRRFALFEQTTQRAAGLHSLAGEAVHQPVGCR